MKNKVISTKRPTVGLKVSLLFLTFVNLVFISSSWATSWDYETTITYRGDVDYYNTLKYVDESLAQNTPWGDAAWDAAVNYRTQGITIGNRAWYLVTAMKLIQTCTGIKYGNLSNGQDVKESIVRESTKRKENVAVWASALFLAREPADGSDCKYTLRVWIKNRVNYRDFPLKQEDQVVFLKGSVFKPVITAYVGHDEVTAQTQDGGTGPNRLVPMHDPSFTVRPIADQPPTYWQWAFDTTPNVFTGIRSSISNSANMTLRPGAFPYFEVAPTNTDDNQSALYFDGNHRGGAQINKVLRDDNTFEFNATDNFMIAFWVKPEELQSDKHWDGGNSRTLVAKHDDGSGDFPFAIKYHPGSGKVSARRYDSTNVKKPAIFSNSNINDGQYHHVAFVKRADYIYLYIDGVAEKQKFDATELISASDIPVFVGSSPEGREFTGGIDDLRIYNYAPSINETNILIGDLAALAPEHPLKGDEYYKIQTIFDFWGCYIQADGTTTPHFTDDNEHENDWMGNWAIEQVGDYVRFRSRKYPNQYLHVENGELEISEIQDSAQSAMWTVEQVENYVQTSELDEFRIVNRFMPNHALETVDSGNTLAITTSTSISTHFKLVLQD